MNYSKALQYFAQDINSDVFYDPEKYFGPNYASVLNFWWYLESLTREQLLELQENYDLNSGQYNMRYQVLVEYAESIVGFDNRYRAVTASRSHVRDIIGQFPNIPAPVTLELMAMHTILDKGEELIFVPMLPF